MNREELLRSKEYPISQIQLGLLEVIGDYKKEKGLKDFQLAGELGVSKGYISQLLNVTFDHKISKLVELSLACNKMPLVYFVDLEKFISDDSLDKIYEIFPVYRIRSVVFEAKNPSIPSALVTNFIYKVGPSLELTS